MRAVVTGASSGDRAGYRPLPCREGVELVLVARQESRAELAASCRCRLKPSPATFRSGCLRGASPPHLRKTGGYPGQ